jgi:ferric-dicitrate binding protein FerR (iron transport regulator)
LAGLVGLQILHEQCVMSASKGHFRNAGLLAGSDVARNRNLGGVRRRPAPARLAFAASAALLLLSTVALLGRSDWMASPAQAEMLAFTTQVGEIRAVALADGSRITLDTRTSVRVAFSQGMRRFILDDGRARLLAAADVRRSWSRPAW